MAPDDTVYEPEQDPKVDPSKVGGECWDYIVARTGYERHICKGLIYSMLYGLHVIDICKRSSLTMYEVTRIRMAFDDFIEGR